MIIVCAAVLVTLGVLLGVAAAVMGYWAGFGGAVTLIVSGGVAYWVATNHDGPPNTEV